MSKRSKKPKHPNHRPTAESSPISHAGTSKLKTFSSDNNIKSYDKSMKSSLSIKSWSVAAQKFKKSSKDDGGSPTPTNDSDDFDCCSANAQNNNLLKARDSLENLIRNERLSGSAADSLNGGGSASSSTAPALAPNPKSLPALNEPSKCTTVTSKSLAYWELLPNHDQPKQTPIAAKTRRSKEKRKKFGEKIKCDRSGDDKSNTVAPPSNISNPENPLTMNNSRSVVFTNEVMVVYFNGERVVQESKEPLKKELDQQLRNKEMRKGHISLS